MQFLYLIFAIAGLIWAGVIMLRGGLIAGSLVVLLAGSCFGHAFYNLPANPIPITSDRLLLVVLAVQAVVFWKLGLLNAKSWGKAEYVLVAFMAVLSLSTITHDWTIDNNQPAAKLVFFYGMPLMLYCIARQATITARQARWMFGLFAGFGVYLSLTAYAEVHEMWAWVFPRYIGWEKFEEYLGRGRGPFLNPTGCGLIITLCMCCALTFWKTADRFGRALIVVLTLVYAVGIYYTLTRSVWMGAAVALLIMIAAGLNAKARVGLMAASGLAGIVFLIWQWDSLTHFKRDRDVSVSDMTESAELRPLLAAVSWQMFLDRPVTGCGFGQYSEKNKTYLSDRSLGLNLEKTRPYVQHNVFLALLTETGLLGAGLFVSLLGLWAHSAWRLFRNPGAPAWARQLGLVFLAFLAAYLINGMFHDTGIVPSLHMYFFFMAAVVSGLTAGIPRFGSLPSNAAQREQGPSSDVDVTLPEASLAAH